MSFSILFSISFSILQPSSDFFTPAGAIFDDGETSKSLDDISDYSGTDVDTDDSDDVFGDVEGHGRGCGRGGQDRRQRAGHKHGTNCGRGCGCGHCQVLDSLHETVHHLQLLHGKIWKIIKHLKIQTLWNLTLSVRVWNFVPCKRSHHQIISLFFPTELFEHITFQSKLYHEQVNEGKQSRKPWEPISVEKVKAFLGVNIPIGIINLPAVLDY